MVSYMSQSLYPWKNNSFYSLKGRSGGTDISKEGKSPALLEVKEFLSHLAHGVATVLATLPHWSTFIVIVILSNQHNQGLAFSPAVMHWCFIMKEEIQSYPDVVVTVVNEVAMGQFFLWVHKLVYKCPTLIHSYIIKCHIILAQI